MGSNSKSNGRECLCRYSTPDKTVSNAKLACNGVTTVTISFSAAAKLRDDPTDIILVMDRSSSISGQRMELAQLAAKRLVKMVADAAGGADPELIAGGSRIGVASFSGTATADLPLTDNVTLIDAAIDALRAGGKTNHNAAFGMAESMLSAQSPKRRIIIMFTDGATTEGGDAVPAADAIKAAGTEIFCIGLLQNPDMLKQWASDPQDAHIAYAADPAELEGLFSGIGAAIIEAGALDAVISEELNPDFEILQAYAPSEGRVMVKGPHSLEWKLDYVGITPADRVSLAFDIMHTGAQGGIKAVNRSIEYRDRAGSALTFPAPTVEVDCSEAAVFPEPCPPPFEFAAEGCRDAVTVALPEVQLASLGRIVQVDVTLKHVCPDRRIAAAVILTELDADGAEHASGVKSVLVPAQTGEGCRNVVLKCISFVVPEALDASGSPASLCNARRFRARVLANYVDTDFVCCAPQEGRM